MAGSKQAKAKEAQERDAVQLMRALQVAEEEAHEAARRGETVRPEKARVLFDLSRQAFQLHQVMQRSWPSADESRRSQLLSSAQVLLHQMRQAL